MADRHPPVLDVAVLCSKVVRDGNGNGNVFALNEPQHTVVVHPDARRKLSAPELMLFLQMTDWDACGTFEFRVEVHSDEGVILRGPPEDCVRVTFVPRTFPFYPFEHVFVLRGLVFPHPGCYDFHVMCGLAPDDDFKSMCARAPRLHVIRGEPGGVPL